MNEQPFYYPEEIPIKTERYISKERATLTIPECIARADKLIDQNGICLMLMDVIGSHKLFDDHQYYKDFFTLISDLNLLLEGYLPENSLTVPNRTDKGFNITTGDGVTAGINDSIIIPLTAEYIETFYPNIHFRYSVAEDGWDSEHMALIR